MCCTMLKNIVTIIGLWITVIIISLITAPKTALISRVLYSLALAAVVWLGFKLGMGQSQKKKASKASAKAIQAKQIYVFTGTDRRFLYRYDGKNVYEGMGNHIIYRVGKNRIYQGLDTQFSYRIEGNKIYRGMERQPLYRIDGSLVYHGRFEKQPAFRISNTASI